MIPKRDSCEIPTNLKQLSGLGSIVYKGLKVATRIRIGLSGCVHCVAGRLQVLRRELHIRSQLGGALD